MHAVISDAEVSKRFLRGMVTTAVTSADQRLVSDSAPSHGEVLYRGVQLDDFSKECKVLAVRTAPPAGEHGVDAPFLLHSSEHAELEPSLKAPQVTWLRGPE